MPLYPKMFSGKMALDPHPTTIKEGDYGYAENITRVSTLEGDDNVITKIQSNTLVGYVLPLGVNKVIGNKEDTVRNRIYYFIWNSNNLHTILYYDITTSTTVKILESVTNTLNNVDILKFNPSYKINHIDIIYRDEGDLIFWNDGLNTPCELDVTFIASLPPNTCQREFIELAKKPCELTPFCFFETDATRLINNFNKGIFKFKVRFLYQDLSKSVTSTQSMVALPLANGGQQVTDPYFQNMISIVVPTGDRNVTKIEILAANSVGNIFSDFYTIKTVDKALEGVPNNDIYYFPFYNDQAYTNILVKESIQLFDTIPHTAYTQACANGNTIQLANINEGYDNPASSATSSVLNDINTNTINQSLYLSKMMAYQLGTSGLIDGNIKIVVLGTPQKDTVYTVKTTNQTITYTSAVGETTQDVINGLQAAATTAGFTIVSNTSRILTIFKTGEKLEYNNTTNNNTEVFSFYPVLARLSCMAHNWWSTYQYGRVYLDKNGVSNGVVYTDKYSVITAPYTERLLTTTATYYGAALPCMTARIYDTPPNWAYSWQLVRTKNLTKGFFVQWVSDITIKEVGGSAVDNSYAYIGINTLDEFISENPASSFLNYDFVTKDRIRFIKNAVNPAITYPYTTSFSGNLLGMTMTLAQSLELPFKVGDTIVITGTVSNNLTVVISAINYVGGVQLQLTVTASVFTIETVSSVTILDTTTPIIYPAKDYEILGVSTNPTINGILYSGRYVKILLPTTSLFFDFGVENYFNYFFELYRPNYPVSDNLNIFYEIGERYAIGNPTTNTRFHQGQTQNQNGGNPAIVKLIEGDGYNRYRNINTVPKYKWNIPKQTIDISAAILVKQRTFEATSFGIVYYSPSYAPKNQLINSSVGGSPPTFPFTGILDINNGESHTFDAKGSFNVKILSSYSTPPASLSVVIAAQDSSTILATTTLATLNSPAFDKTYNLTLNGTITVPAGTTNVFAYLSFPLGSTGVEVSITASSISLIETNKTVTVGVIDPNFSDFFQSGVNNNGRSWAFDINAKRQTFPTTIRFSNDFQQNSNVNDTNRFYAENIDDYDRSAGAIKKMFVDGRELFVFHEYNVGIVPVYQQILKTATGSDLVSQIDQLLNKIQYPYKGKFGIGNVPESFAYNKFAKFFIDPNKKVCVRLSQNGLNEISVIYECDAFFKDILGAYNSSLNNGNAEAGQPYKGNPTIYGAYDTYTNRYIIFFEEIKRYDALGVLEFRQLPKTIVYNNNNGRSEGFESFITNFPENAGFINTLLYTFENGKLLLGNGTTYNTFNGFLKSSFITAIFNKDSFVKKTFNAIRYQAQTPWASSQLADYSGGLNIDAIVTSFYNPQTGYQQSSSLKLTDYEFQEGIWCTSFLRDLNSGADPVLALVEGDFLQGFWLKIKFIESTNQYNYITNLVMSYQALNKTP